MKKNLLFIILLCSWFANSQILEPVKWSTSVEKLSDSEYKLITKASIDKGWHLYSQDVPEDGPIPTSFTYNNENGSIKLIGATSEKEGHTVNDPVFEMKITFFEDSTTFEQKVKVTGNTSVIHGIVEFMVCDDERCLPPTEVDLTFNLPVNTKDTTTGSIKKKN